MHTQKPCGFFVAHLRHFRILSSSLHMRLLYAEQGNSWPHGPAHSLDAALVLIQLLHLCVISHIREVNAARMMRLGAHTLQIGVGGRGGSP